MKIRLLILFCLLFSTICVFAQDLGKEYKVIPVNKQVSEISCDNPYQSPLENYVARMYSWIDGRYEPIHSEITDAAVRKSRSKPYPQEEAENLLNSDIEEVITYKDSIGLVFRREKAASDYYLVGMSCMENGKWLSIGEDICNAKNRNEAKQYIENKSVKALNYCRQYYRQSIVSTDTLAFVDYLRENGKEPVSFLINSLKNNKIVIYGELHFRESSWNLLNELIQSPKFTAVSGAVFLELSINAQSYLDNFFNNERKDTNLILNILRNEELTGWTDKGMYDFLVKLWDINSQLPKEKKIKVFATDFPRPFYCNITRLEQYEEFLNPSDRNEYMANTIENYFASTNDKRNCLFVVGLGHAYKSNASTTGQWQINGKSAANLLCEKFGQDAVFTIYTHTPLISNDGILFGKIRKGLFDRVFAKNGNRTTAFNLKGSPFGKEPFDGDADIRFDIQTGSFENNFDAYIFLQALEEEIYLNPLIELFTDEYIEEIIRRAKIIHSEDEIFWGIKLKDINRLTLINAFKERGKQRRWNLSE